MAPRHFFAAGQKRSQCVRLGAQHVTRDLHAPHQFAERRHVTDRPLPLLTVEEASIRLSVSVRALYHLIHEQGLPVRRLGRAIRIDQGELEEWTRRERQDDMERFPVLVNGRKG